MMTESEFVCYLIGLVIGFVAGLVMKDTKRNDRSVCIKIKIHDDNDETKNENNKTKDVTDNNVGDKEEEEA